MSSPCRHPVVYHGLCASCGADLDKPASGATAASAAAVAGAGSGSSSGRAWSRGAAAAPSSSSSSSSSSFGQAIVLGGAHKTIHLSAEALRDTSRRNSLALLQSRKLLCVLDLDHTLLHATSDPRVAPFVGREEDLFSFTLPAHGPVPPASSAGGAPRPGGHRPAAAPSSPAVKTHYVKLRPWLSDFLTAAASLFDMHVYTMGARAYADAVVPILDPTHALIKHRVVSRDETGGDATNPALAATVAKSLKRMHPCDEALIAIVDDRVDVWRENSKNVVRAFEYLYFSGRGGEMNARPQSLGQMQGTQGRDANQQHQQRGDGGAGAAAEYKLLPPIRSKPLAPALPSKPSSLAAAAAACGVLPVPSPTGTPSPPAPAVPAAAAAPAPAASGGAGGGSKLRRRKATGPAPPPLAEMKAMTHAPYSGRAGHAAPVASAASSSAAQPIVLDGSDDEKETAPKGAAASAASIPTAASAPAPSSEAVRMEIDDDDDEGEDPEAAALRALDAAIDLTDSQHDAIEPALPASPARAGPSPYHGDSASLPIFPYQFASHPCPDNVLLSLTAVLRAVHTLFYEQVDLSVQEQTQLRESGTASAHTATAAAAATAAPSSPHSARSADPLAELLPLGPRNSVPRILSLLKRTTLSGCVIVFSGVFPTVKPNPHARNGGGPARGGSGAQRAEAWLAATAFGATCLEEFPEVEAAQRRQQKLQQQLQRGEGAEPEVGTEVEMEEDAPVVPFGKSDLGSGGGSTGSAAPLLRVTHVVAARDGSAKTHLAHALPAGERPFVVHVSWLWHSIAHFQRGDEAKFPLWPEHRQGQAAQPTVAQAVPPASAATATAAAATSSGSATPAAPAVAPSAAAAPTPASPSAPVSVPPTTAATGAIVDDATSVAVPAASAASSAPAASTPSVAAAAAVAAGDAPMPGATISPVEKDSSVSAPIATTAPAAAAPTVPAPPAPASAVPAAKTGAVPIRRRIPKKVPAPAGAVAATPASDPAAAPAAAAASSLGAAAAAAAVASSAPVAAPSAASAAAAAPSPSSPSSSVAAASALPTPGTVGLHLVHHVSVPPSASGLVERVRAYLRTEATEAARRRAAEEITQAEEMVKAAQLTSRLRRSPLASDGSASSSASGASQTKPRRKSVSFSGMELGPTNPRFAVDTHTSSLAEEGDRGLLSPSCGGIKRKSGAMHPLDDVDRTKKSAHQRVETINLADDDDDVCSGVTTAELYGHAEGGGDGPGAEEEDDGFGELNEDLFNDELDGGGDYEDEGRFDDDM